MSVCPAAKSVPLTERAPSSTADPGPEEPGAEPGSEPGVLEVEARVEAHWRTGVEMEALVAASAAALTVYDMCKAVDREMTVERVRLVAKQGGKSGRFVRAGERVDGIEAPEGDRSDER